MMISTYFQMKLDEVHRLRFSFASLVAVTMQILLHNMTIESAYSQDKVPFPSNLIGIYGTWECKNSKLRVCTLDDGFNGTVIGPATANGIRVRIITFGFQKSYEYDALAFWTEGKLTASASQFPDQGPCVIDFIFNNKTVENRPKNIEKCGIYGWIGHKDKLISNSLSGT